MNIFVSRPAKPCIEYVEGIGIFIDQLRLLGVFDKTLGVNQYTNSTPLHAVCSLLDDCVGAIILGVPKKRITFCGNFNHNFSGSLEFETPWNHIEGAIAYKLGLPILLIAHKTIGEGVFDKGVVGQYVIEVDMNSSSWALESNCQVPLRDWINLIRTNHSI